MCVEVHKEAFKKGQRDHTHIYIYTQTAQSYIYCMHVDVETIYYQWKKQRRGGQRDKTFLPRREKQRERKRERQSRESAIELIAKSKRMRVIFAFPFADENDA